MVFRFESEAECVHSCLHYTQEFPDPPQEKPRTVYTVDVKELMEEDDKADAFVFDAEKYRALTDWVEARITGAVIVTVFLLLMVVFAVTMWTCHRLSDMDFQHRCDVSDLRVRVTRLKKVVLPDEDKAGTKDPCDCTPSKSADGDWDTSITATEKKKKKGDD